MFLSVFAQSSYNPYYRIALSAEVFGHTTMVPLFLTLLPSILLCLFIVSVVIRKARIHLPPGPFGLPVIGHLHLVGTQPVRSLTDLGARYGSLMFLRFGSVPVLVASSPEAARLILRSYDDIFSYRTVPSVSFISFEGKDLLFAQPGPYYKYLRRLAASELFSTKRLHSFRPIIKDEIRGLLEVVADKADCVDLRTILYDAMFTIISRMAISRKANDLRSQSQDDPSSSLQSLLIQSIEILGVVNVGDYIPWLAWMDLQGCSRRTKAITRNLKAIWQEIIDDRRKRRLSRESGIEDADFLDVLLTASTQDEVEITDIGIMGVLTNMFGAAIDTSSLTIEWALAELLMHPRILKKAQKELQAIAKSARLMQESDIVDLPYLRAIVKETMRLHPVVPLLVPHMASQDCKVSGYDIPSGTQTFINVWAIGRDPNVWEDPLIFYPERFMDSSVDLRGQHFELIPFGSGRRACPGLNLGLNNVHLMLANLLHAFEWEKLGEVDLSPNLSIALSLANHLLAKATLKIPRFLIEFTPS
ncbi:hypothetical protein KP509_33G042900 [Ceratopteris richardii]|uniref:Cytochrome P450 n=1 Tax=Ceratopteris richardii TaxID=49495 RepID=A0A8T2QNZ9_CERRI|nr:hypothetical protein KP509_33G042900 [Ceratopteris richardii]